MALLCAQLPAHASEGPLLAAASSLRSLWPILVQSYADQTSELAPRVSFGSSGLLSTQIINGAPFELFLSADLASVDRLSQHVMQQPPQVFATGALSIAVPESSPLSPSLSMDTLADALLNNGNAQTFRLAIPNPVHAPYGIAAREVLENANLWPLPVGQLLSAENAAQTLQFVKNGGVAAAIVPQALVHARKEGLVVVNIPVDSYTPVKHVIAIFQVAGDSAKAFHKWLLGDDARQILEHSGLQAPEPTP